MTANRHASQGAIAAVLMLAAGIGIYLSAVNLPAINQAPPGVDTEFESITPTGFGIRWAIGFCFLLLALVYLSEYLILKHVRPPAVQVALFGLVLLASLPYIWFLVGTDWQNPFVYRISCWLFDPIGVLFIPTCHFAWAMAYASKFKGWVFALLAACECVVIFPLWIYFWLFFSFYCLGGGWL